MREFLGIILTVVITVVLPAIDERVKRRRRQRSASGMREADDIPDVPQPVMPALPERSSMMTVPEIPAMPEEVVRVTVEPDDDAAPRNQSAAARAYAREHFEGWRRAIVASEVLRRNKY
ncbi:MAG: hypothetical protein NC043_05145 [Muribaculaceae bacterium]|nr:hypothetical protein [Muribaculaceae bacterium]